MGSITGKNREFMKALKKSKENMGCMLETQWKKDKTRKFGDRYNMLHSENRIERNRVRAILNKLMKMKMMTMLRKSDRFIIVKLVLGASIFTGFHFC